VIVVTGADGQLGTAFRSVIATDAVFLTREDLDLSDVDRIAPTISSLKPTCVINCAAYTDVDAAESDEETANTVNGRAVGELAAACRELDARFVTFSTDYVFDGEKSSLYVESDEPNPLNAYGRSKLLGERLALEADPESLVIRTSWLLSGTHGNFLRRILGRLETDQSVSVVSDQIGVPTFVRDLAPATIEAIGRGTSGVLHLVNDGESSWFDLARQIARIAGVDPDLVVSCSADEYPSIVTRPRYSVLGSDRLDEEGIARMPQYLRELERTVREALKGE
jgi:dTDP-4-dehydrorhamnose reductase